mmetsp:Transcript_8453/g.24979  ORF Transcript_8453/g.24979 Transcript_8453/m.24979 type:complete len:249 (-) Transcript_8453:765-1511(-)
MSSSGSSSSSSESTQSGSSGRCFRSTLTVSESTSPSCTSSSSSTLASNEISISGKLVRKRSMSACCDSDSFVRASRRFCGPSARSFSIGELALASLPPPSSSREHALTCAMSKCGSCSSGLEWNHIACVSSCENSITLMVAVTNLCSMQMLSSPLSSRCEAESTNCMSACSDGGTGSRSRKAYSSVFTFMMSLLTSPWFLTNCSRTRLCSLDKSSAWLFLHGTASENSTAEERMPGMNLAAVCSEIWR